MQTAEKVFWIGPKPDILIAEIQVDKKRKEEDVNEDIAFLKDQMVDRKMSIGKEDQRYTLSVSRSKKKKITPEDAATEFNDSVSSVSSGDISEDGEETEDRDYVEELTDPGEPEVPVLPKDILSQTAVTAAGEGITPHQHTALVTSVIALSGGNVAEFACSLSTSVRSKETAVQKGAEEIRSMIQKKADSTNFPIGLYCDGKLVQELTDGKRLKKDRIAISVRIDNQTELLGIPGTDSGTGEAQVELMQPLLEQYNLMDKIKFMCFDTTASNTGQHSGVCTRIVRLIQNPILHLGCRHHVNERHVVHFWKNYPGSKTTGPDNQLFKKLKTQWNHIDTGLETKLNKLVIHPGSFLSEAKSEALQFAKNIINFNVMNQVHLLISS